MTDGIIQKVLNKEKYPDTVTHPIHKARNMLINRIEQELIAEIKKQVDSEYTFGQAISLKTLIGDNQ